MAGKTNKTNKAPEKSDDKKPYTIIDVNHPGKSAADASGVPVIVSNRPVLKDPMVVDDKKAESDGADGEAILTRPKKINVQPLDESSDPKTDEKDDSKTIAEIAVEADAKAAEKKSKTDSTKPTKDSPEDVKQPDDDDKSENEEETAAEPKKSEPTPRVESEPDELSQSDTESDEDSQLGGADPKAAEAARKAAEKQLTLDKMANAGTYSLPINAVEKRRVKRFAIVIVLLLVVLGIAWVDLALDAQLIQINGINAPTDFFPDR